MARWPGADSKRMLTMAALLLRFAHSTRALRRVRELTAAILPTPVEFGDWRHKLLCDADALAEKLGVGDNDRIPQTPASGYNDIVARLEETGAAWRACYQSDRPAR